MATKHAIFLGLCQMILFFLLFSSISFPLFFYICVFFYFVLRTGENYCGTFFFCELDEEEARMAKNTLK